MTPAVETRAALKVRIAALIARLADGSHDEAARDALMTAVITYQANRVEPYKRWLEVRQASNGPLEWPGLPTDVFRHARVASFSEGEQHRVFLTSGTTQGPRGCHPFRDLSLYDLSAKAAAAYALFFDGARQLVILGPREDDAPESSLTYMLSRFEEWFGEGQAVHAWRDGRVDVEVLSRAIAEATGPVAILGTSFAWVHVLDATDGRLPTPPGSWAMQTGGFKARSRVVEPEALRNAIAERFRLTDSSVVSEYGMTELSSQLYELKRRDPDAPRTYWVPGWVRASVVDAETLVPVQDGDVGLLRIDDLANLDSVVAIQTSDLARIREGNVELIGRAEGAPLRGCSLSIEEAYPEWRQ